MKKILLVAFLFCAQFSFGQGIPQLIYNQAFTATGNSTGQGVAGRGLGVYKVSWSITNGTFSACDFDIESSPNNATWSNVTSLTAVTCTTSGQTALVAATMPWFRIVVNTLTASSAGPPILTVVVMAWNDVSGGTSGAPTTVTIDTSGNTVKIQDSAGNQILASTNPCEGVIPTRVAISQTADTTLISASSGKTNYICSYLFVVDNSSAATEIINVIEGTGAGCVTTQTAAIMGSTTEANGMKITGNGIGGHTIVPGSGTNVNTCLMQSGTARISGFLTYAQQ